MIDLQIDSLVEFTGKKRRKRLLYASMSSDRVHAIISALPCNPLYFCYKIEKTYQFIASFYVYIILQYTCYQHAKATKIRAKRTDVSVGLLHKKKAKTKPQPKPKPRSSCTRKADFLSFELSMSLLHHYGVPLHVRAYLCGASLYDHVMK